MAFNYSPSGGLEKLAGGSYGGPDSAFQSFGGTDFSQWAKLAPLLLGLSGQVNKHPQSPQEALFMKQAMANVPHSTRGTFPGPVPFWALGGQF